MEEKINMNCANEFNYIVQEKLEKIRLNTYTAEKEIKELVLKRNDNPAYNKRIDSMIEKAYGDPNTLYVEHKQNGYVVIVYLSKENKNEDNKRNV